MPRIADRPQGITYTNGFANSGHAIRWAIWITVISRNAHVCIHMSHTIGIFDHHTPAQTPTGVIAREDHSSCRC